MKRTARNLLQQIQESNGSYDTSTLPARVLESWEAKEEALVSILSECENRKHNYSRPFSAVYAENNRDLANTLSLGIPAVNILNLCGLLISSLIEADNEIIFLRARLDQLEAQILDRGELVCK